MYVYTHIFLFQIYSNLFKLKISFPCQINYCIIVHPSYFKDYILFYIISNVLFPSREPASLTSYTQM